MNQEQAITILRQLLLTFSGGLVSAGYLDQVSATVAAGALATLVVTVGWGIYARRNNALVASAAAVPGVAAIQATPKIADAVPSSKVTAAF